MGKLIFFVESDLPSGRSAGGPSFFFWNLIRRRRLWSFLKFAFFNVLACSPLASGRQKRFFYFIKTGDKEHRNQIVFFSFLKVARSFPPRRQPATLGSARGPTAGTPCGNLSWLTRLMPFVCCAFLGHFHVPPWHSAVGPQGV